MIKGNQIFKILALLCLVFPGSSSATETLTILHTNDMHGNLLSVDEGVGGFARIGGYVQSVRASTENVLLLDAGDTIIGTPMALATKGECIVDGLNAIGYDAMVLGNSEFYYGADHIENVKKWARFPIISANVTAKSNERLLADAAYTIKNVGGIKVGIFGLTTAKLGSNLVLQQDDTVFFKEILPVAQYWAEELNNQDVDLIIALTHIGSTADKELAREVPGIDIVISGESHLLFEEPYIDPGNGTMLVQAGAHGRFVGRLDVTLDSDRKRIVSHEYSVIAMTEDTAPVDQKVSALVEKWVTQTDSVLNTKIAHAPQILDRSGIEKRLGNWQADVIRQAVHADIAFMNNAGMRADLPAGDITATDIMRISPFSNSIYVFEAKGHEIKEMLEHGLKDKGEILQISGFQYTFDLSQPEGQRVVQISLDESERYKVATLRYLAQWNPQHFFGTTAVKATDTSILFWQAQTEFAKKTGQISASVEGRIKDLIPDK